MAFAFESDDSGLPGVLSRLSAAGLHEAGVRARLGLRDLNDIALKAHPIYRRERLATRDALAAAIDLFVLQAAVPTSEVESLLGAASLACLVRAGALERRGDSYRAVVSIYPVGPSLIFSDPAWPQLEEAGHASVPYDQVMYVGVDSRWLARATVRTPVPAALDLCCGSGLHALLAAGHVERATAVDINPRAVRCTSFNARALGRANVEVLQGDLYEAVPSRTFGLITANPPFVPAPAQEVAFRDGGLSGEDVQRRIVEGLPRHLAKGGTAQIVTQLGERAGESLERRLREWLGGAPMNIHVLRLRKHSAEAYAMGYAQGGDVAATLASVDRWSANLRTQGYHQVVSVLLAFQWSDDPWFREDEAEPPLVNAGSEVLAVFRSEKESRDRDLPDRLRGAVVARAGALALAETQSLGVNLAAVIRAWRLGVAMPVEHRVDAVERDVLTSLTTPVATSSLLAVAARAGVPDTAVLGALASLLRKGLLRVEGGSNLPDP